MPTKDELQDQVDELEAENEDLKRRLELAAAHPVAVGTPDVEAPDGAILRVSAHKERGFCRAGRRWGKSPTYVMPGELDEAQVAALKAEKNLTVHDLK